MRKLIVSTIFALMSASLVGIAQQDTAKVAADTTKIKATFTDSLKPSVPAPAKPKAKYQIDTTFEAVNLERLYYGMDGQDAAYENNPWDDYLFQDADGREEDERDQRDQERDSRE